MPDHKPICRRRFVKKRRAIGKCSVAQNLLCHLQQRCAPRHPSNRRNAQRMSYPSSAVRKIRAFQFLKQPVDLPLPEHSGNDRESAFPRCFHPAQFVSLLPPITRIIHANLRSRHGRAPLCVLYVDYVFLLSYPSTRRVESLRFREVTSPGRSFRKSCRKNTRETPSRTAHSKPLTEKITSSESTLTKKAGGGSCRGPFPYLVTSLLLYFIPRRALRVHGGAEDPHFVRGRHDFKPAALQRAHFHHFVHQPVQQSGLDEFRLRPSDEKRPRALHVDAGGRGCRQRAMAQLHKFRAPGIARPRILKHFLRLQVKKSHAHRPAAENSFQVPFATAAAETLLRVQRDHRVPAFPHAFTRGIPPT